MIQSTLNYETEVSMASIFDKIGEAFSTNDEVDVNEAVQAAATAGALLAAVGGKENVKFMTSCATRLRLQLADPTVVDDEACKKAGAIGVLHMNDDKLNVHVVLGTEKVQNVADAFAKLI